MNLFRSTTKHKFWLLISAPSLLVALLFIVASLYSVTIFRAQIERQALSTLELFSIQNEKVIMGISPYLERFEDNSAIMSLLNDTDIVNSPYIENTKTSIKNLEETFDYIDSIFVISKDRASVLTSEGFFPSKTYFNTMYCYNDYDYEYWNNFNFYSADSYRILSPTMIKENTLEKQIIPVIFRQIGSSKIKNLTVVNLRLDVITKNNETFKYTPNTKFYILNKYTARVYSNYPNQYNIPVIGTELYDNLTKDVSTFSYNSDDGTKCTVFSYSSTNHLLGYTYFSVVPNSDINKGVYPLITLTIVLLIVLFLFIIITTARNTNTLISPMLQLAQQFSSENLQPNIDLFDYLNTSTSSLIKANENLSVTLPYAQEKYLIDYLNNVPTYYSTNTEELLKQSLPFNNKYFCCAIICIQPTTQFFETFNSIEYTNIRQGFFNIVREIFASQFPSFMLSSDKETLCIIINPETADSIRQKINEIIKVLNDSLKNDSSYIEFYTGVGEVYKDFEGLKKSYHNALKSLSIQPLSAPHLDIAKSAKTIKYILSPNDETKLLSLLLAYNYDNAFSLIKNYIAKNDGIDVRSLKQFYSQILSVIFKAMRMKNIDYGVNQNDTEIISEILSKTPDDIYKSILSLMQNFRTNSLQGIKLDEKEIITYINENFKDYRLSLDNLANKFNCSPTYLSTFLKTSLNMGYHQYITFLRIEEAKRLLKYSNKPIQEIYTEIGFSSKQTFVRAFKSLTAITPSEYRKNEK